MRAVIVRHPRPQIATLRPIPLGTPWLALLLVLGVLAASGIVGFTSGAFSDTTSNGGNSFSAASTFCGTPGTQTLIADADSYVEEQRPTNNHGSATSLRVQSRAGGRNQRTLVHFALVPSPLCTVTSATLRLFTGSGDAGRTLQAYQAATPWTEDTVTWVTQPLTLGNPSTTASAVGWIQFNVTAQTQSLFGGPNTGFLVKDAAESQNPARNQQFNSREASNYLPELVITLA